MLKTFINGIIREKAKMHQYFTRERCLRKTKQTKGKPSNPRRCYCFKLDMNQGFFGLTLKKYKLHTSPHFQNMPKNYLLTQDLQITKESGTESWKISHQNKHADQYLQRNIPKQVQKGTFTQKMSMKKDIRKAAKK